MRICHSRTRLALELGLIGGAALAYGWGRWDMEGRAHAAPPPPAQAPQSATPLGASGPSADYSKRVVGYIFGNIPITREELGEYLIARHGAAKLELLMNKRIIEHVCQQKGIEVTAAEVEADLAESLHGLNMDRAQFVQRVLKQYNKTLYEWKEDVVRPRLLMSKLCRDRVKITDEDLQKEFEARYGEKVKCRIILIPRDIGSENLARKIWEKVRHSEEEFDRAARNQPTAALAATGGRVNPVGRHSGDEKLVKTAFSLKEGELSSILEMTEGWVLLKCDGREPPDTSKRLADVRPELEKAVLEKKITAEIPKLFAELKKEAEPKQILREGETFDELEIQKEIGIQPVKGEKPPGKPR